MLCVEQDAVLDGVANATDPDDLVVGGELERADPVQHLEILERILPLYIDNVTYRALVENAAAEQGSRRTAMKAATDNADDLLTNLRRQFNRARQAEITSQIAEIIGGAEALAGK